MISIEYGLNPHIGVVGDFDFLNDFNRAEFLGIGYLDPYFTQNIDNGVGIALIFDDKTNGEKAFNNLLRWMDYSDGDGDAVSIEIIENSSGYTLCLFPNEKKLMERTYNKHLLKWVNPLTMIPIYYKKIDYFSNEYKGFKKQIKDEPLLIFAVDKEFDFLAGKRYLKKYEVNIYNEQNIPEKSPNYMHFKKLGKEGYEDSIKRIHNVSKDIIEKIRMDKIKYFFPLTYEKILNCDNLYERYLFFESEYSIEQIIQALCNINLYERILNGNLIQEIEDDENIQLNILEYLYENPEVFESHFIDFEQVPIEKLRLQLISDKNQMELGRRSNG
ncbi:hypothetical protein ABE61_05295 [Lysinibacillus sphaericus]|uniref:hypothetical protein n=1 Tax=Lysinibacillus sphaericus TaxID=1421 RepID=UPI0018CE4681|nr:hypothetical protein [Lysinibacillus sphaericus]MBG9453509.1 hypothetical protein [Lysinibacillus sphaericus]MBG9480348.1 hypothetical protein [Lysinibacillus sphaericus]MBG9595027.1 hypothetical protein [Lysinibacillus sphaericus]